MLKLPLAALVLLLQRAGACDCNSCTDSDDIYDTKTWYLSSTCASNARAYVEDLKVASTDGSSFRITTSDDDSFDTYYSAASSSRDSKVTCFNMADNLRVGGGGRQIYVKFECKNMVYSCPIEYDINFACHELPTPRPTPSPTRPTPAPTPYPTRNEPTPAPTVDPNRPSCDSENVTDNSSCNEYCGGTSNYSWSTVNDCGFCRCPFSTKACGGGCDDPDDVSGALGAPEKSRSVIGILVAACLAAQLIRA